MIQIENLSKKYGNREVVSHVSLHIKKGDVLGFIGPNGAGKSTTIRMISGVLPVYSGKILIDGIDIALSPRQGKNRIGYLPENAPLPPNMTVRAFLKHVAAMRGISFFKRKKAIRDAVKSCALENVLDQEIESLSKGYKRRVCFAQAIIHKPPVLLLDEPTDGLDPNQKREMRNLIKTLSKDTAIIISTHILEEVRSVCSKVLLLSEGKIVFQGTTEMFTGQEDELQCYALTFPMEQLHDAATLLTEKFHGSCRLSNDTLIVFEEIAKNPELPAILEQAGLKLLSSAKSQTTLDDVFAKMTQKQKTAPVSQPQEMICTPAAIAEKEDDNDDN
ncbi:MAG: ABC transporter ATP-binding protein [Lentisphaeria bacterium]|nr:ABC transporter ATP-binding protein [Lentisphaeria bacterium]